MTSEELDLYLLALEIYHDMILKDFPKDLTKELHELIIDLEKRWVTIDGRHVNIGGDDSGSSGNQYHSLADPMVEVFGDGEKSHPKEIQAYQKELQALGVELIRRDKEMLAYSPSLRAGMPGTVYISKGASYSAWSHEMQHVRDDYADGWTGMRILENPDKRYQREVKAYQIEINLASKANRPDIVQRLQDNLEKERREIYGE